MEYWFFMDINQYIVVDCYIDNNQAIVAIKLGIVRVSYKAADSKSGRERYYDDSSINVSTIDSFYIALIIMYYMKVTI